MTAVEEPLPRGEPGMRRLRATGAVDRVRSWQQWLLRHRRAVGAALGAHRSFSGRQGAADRPDARGLLQT
ncbi:hypothetical protein ACL02O_16775 [Micromonospora sp. MS34]|uniref:hypothetical protein n=1 Tax=Micromonospora sp. MS34 TaxID=3385971 RepID=UPI0039A24F63